MSDLLGRLKTAIADHYVIDGELGAGGMATVYLAEDVKHHRKVAVKVLRPELAAAIGPERFLREIEIAANLAHPHILPLHDSGQADGFLYYVMPYVEGESLRDRLAREKQLAVGDAIELTRQVARALAYAHDRNVLHRDIKPENILLTEGVAVVADFGIAKAIEAAGGESLTETGMAVGTPAYMSPEQAAGTRDIDGRSDVYGLGCVLYEMLAGAPPFTGPTAQNVVHQHLTVDPPSVTTFREKVPAEIAGAVERALAKTPADRFATAADFAEALGEQQVVTGQATAGRRVSRPAVGVAVVLLALVAGWWGVSTFLSSSSADGVVTLAVLAPENISEDPGGLIFADGIHEELLNALAGISGLGVTGRTSVMYYREHPKQIDEIAAELGVDAVVEMSVRRVDDNVRITVQLIDGASQQHLWSQPYDRRYAASEIFAIQEDVARQIAAELRLQLSGEEEARLGEVPTQNTQAYELYLQATARLRGGGVGSRQEGIDLLRRVVALDPDFAVAWATMSTAMIQLVVDDYRYDLAEEALAARRRAEELAPSSFETLTMTATWLYYSDYDLDAARDRFERALRLRPNNPRVLLTLGQIERRTGNWDAALRRHYAALELDPLWPGLISSTQLTEMRVHNWGEVNRLGERFTGLTGRGFALEVGRRLMGHGDPEAVRRWADSLAPSIDPDQAAVLRLRLATFERDFDVALEGYRTRNPGDHFTIARLCYLQRDLACQRAYADSLIAFHTNNLATLEKAPIPVWPRAWAYEQTRLGLAHVLRGNRDEAITWGKRAVETAPPSVDAYTGEAYIRTLAETYVVLGEYELAVAMLDRMLSGPHYYVVNLLKVDPWYDPLRDHAGFQALLAKYDS